MSDKVRAKTKFSSFEYQAEFVEPVLDPFRVFSASNAVYRGLKPWNVSPQDVKYRGGGLSPAEPLISFELAKSHYTVSLAMANFGFKANYAAWDQAPVIIEIIQSTEKALGSELSVTVADHSLTITMQLGIEGRSIRELTSSLSVPLGYPANETDFYGFMLYTKQGFLVVDKSAADPNDLFVRIVRKYSGIQDMSDMAKGLYEDEQRLAQALSIEIE